MLIKRVALQNWRSHKNTQLEFTKGTNILVGIMGSGKSSVLEAICFALYGTFPALARKRIKLGQIVAHGNPNAVCKVEVAFEKDGKEYTIARTISDGKSDAEIRENGRLVETKSEAVTKMVEHILGVDYDLFSKAVYAEQNSLDYFLSLNPGERKKQIDDLIGIDRFELARANTTRLANKLSEDAEKNEREIARYNKGNMLSERETIRKQLESAYEKRTRLVKESEEINTRVKMLGEKKEELEHKRRRYEELSREIIECNAYVESASKRVKNYTKEDFNKIKEEIAGLVERTGKIKSAVEEKEKELTELNRKSGELETNIRNAELKIKEMEELEKRLNLLGAVENGADIREKIGHLTSQLFAVEKEHSAKSAEISILEREVNALKDEIQEIEKLRKENAEVMGVHQRDLDNARSSEVSTVEWIASLKEMMRITQESIDALSREEGSICPVCESPLDSKKKEMLIAKRKEIIENSRKELAENEKKLGEIKREIERLEKGLKKKSDIETKLQTSEAKEKEYNEKSKKIEELRRVVLENEHKITELKSSLNELNEKARKTEEAEKIRQKIEDARKFIAGHKDDNKIYDGIRKMRDECALALRQLRDELSKYENEVVRKRGVMEEIQDDLKIQEEIRNKREQLIKVKSESERVGYDERSLQEITREYNEALMKKREIEINLENISQNIVLLERNLDTIEKQIAEVERREKELMDVREAIKTASEFQQSIIETQVLLRNELVSSINLVIDKIWDVIYPYGDLERVQLEATESDYYIKVKRNNEWVVVEGNVSGGERASVALALRVALSIVLAPNLSILALDEPTHNLDENGVKALCDILRERLPKIIGQSFIITHDDKLKEGASGRVYLFSRNKRAGEPTQVTLDNPEI